MATPGIAPAVATIDASAAHGRDTGEGRLVVAQVTLAVTVILVAGLVARSQVNLETLDLVSLATAS